jgi:hypothetical protein
VLMELFSQISSISQPFWLSPSSVDDLGYCPGFSGLAWSAVMNTGIRTDSHEGVYIYRNTEAHSQNHCCHGKAINITYFHAHICVCVCVCVRTGTGMCLCVCNLTNPPCNTPSYCHLQPLWLYHIFRHYLINGTIFGKQLLNIKYVF